MPRKIEVELATKNGRTKRVDSQMGDITPQSPAIETNKSEEALERIRKAAEERRRRAKETKDEEEEEEEPSPVSQGNIDKVVDYIFNPTHEKIREVTVVDRIQGRLLPQLDVIDVMWQHAIEISAFRQDAPDYEKIFKRKRPVYPNLIEIFTYRTAQWQKSIGGVNMKSGVDLALAEMETRGDEMEDSSSGGYGEG